MLFIFFANISRLELYAQASRLVFKPQENVSKSFLLCPFLSPKAKNSLKLSSR